MTKQTITLTQTQINQAINALEEASRVLGILSNLHPDQFHHAYNDIAELKQEVNSSRKTLSQAQHNQIYLND